MLEHDGADGSDGTWWNMVVLMDLMEHDGTMMDLMEHDGTMMEHDGSDGT